MNDNFDSIIQSVVAHYIGSEIRFWEQILLKTAIIASRSQWSEKRNRHNLQFTYHK
jgi:hypothetical protein